MKAEEEDVDIMTIDIPGSPSHTFGIPASATRPGSAHPSGTPTPGASGLGQAKAHGNGDVTMLDVNIDLDTLWAEQEPDDDVPGGWRMKVLMEDDEEE